MMGSNCNDWVLESKKRRLRNVVDILEPGDIVRMPSIVFTHYGIAVGDGCMIHLVPEPEQNRFLGRGLYEQVDIVEYCLEKNKSCQKDNSRDNRDGWVPYASSEVVARANSKLRNASEVYSMVFNNCEKFALWCRYRNQVGLGDQSLGAMLLGAASMVIFGPAFTLGAGALAVKAALSAPPCSPSQPSGKSAASSPSVAYASEKAIPVAAKSASTAAVKSTYRFTSGENPLQTFPTEFGTKFVNGMITEVAYDAGSSMMTSKKVNDADSDDTNEGGVNEFWTKCVLGASVATTSRAFIHDENPLDTLGEEFAEKVALGGAAKVLEIVIGNSSLAMESFVDTSSPAAGKSKRKRNNRNRKK